MKRLKLSAYQYPHERAEFESTLAKLLTDKPELNNLMQAINALFVELFDQKIGLICALAPLYEDSLDEIIKTLEAFSKRDDLKSASFEELMHLLHHALQDCKDPFQLSTLHKLVCEVIIIGSTLIDPKNATLQHSLKALQINVPDHLLPDYKPHMRLQESTGLFWHFRPMEYFGENRARQLRSPAEMEAFPKRRDFGIHCYDRTPPWAVAALEQRAVSPRSMDFFVPKPYTFTVRLFQILQQPFVSGASGTIGFILPVILSLKDFAKEPFPRKQLKDIFVLYAAIEVGLGHHSFYETLCIANRLGLIINYCSSPFKEDCYSFALDYLGENEDFKTAFAVCP